MPKSIKNKLVDMSIGGFKVEFETVCRYMSYVKKCRKAMSVRDATMIGAYDRKRSEMHTAIVKAVLKDCVKTCKEKKCATHHKCEDKFRTALAIFVEEVLTNDE